MFEKCKLKRKISKLKKEIDLTNNNDARFELAMIYLDGSILKKDEKQAFDLLKTASKNGHLKAKAFLFSNKALEVFNRSMDALDDIKNIIQE